MDDKIEPVLRRTRTRAAEKPQEAAGATIDLGPVCVQAVDSVGVLRAKVIEAIDELRSATSSGAGMGHGELTALRRRVLEM